MAHFSSADLEKLGLQENGDGTFSKKKTVSQPREIKWKQEMSIARTDVIVTGNEIKTIDTLTGLYKLKREKQCIHFKGMDIQDVYADAEKNNYIFIPGNVPSLKNSKQLFKNKYTGKMFITSSALCKKYVTNSEIHWRIFQSSFFKLIEGKQKPYKLQLFFIRDKHKSFDFGNISQIVLDCMTGNAYFPKSKDKELKKKFAWIEDDDANNIVPNYDAGFGYDPKLSGVIIRVL